MLPGHIFRGSRISVERRSVAVMERTSSSSVPAGSPSVTPPRHTEHRPHGALCGSSSDSVSSVIRQALPCT